MQQDHGEIVFYQAENGESSFEVSLYEESVWLSLKQMVELFDCDKSVVSRHLNNIFKTGELKRDAVVEKMQQLPLMEKHIRWTTIPGCNHFRWLQDKLHSRYQVSYLGDFGS